MIFEDFGLPIAYEAAFFMQCMQNPYLSMDELGDLSLTVSQKLRSLAIMALVSKSDRSLLGQNLARSGYVRLSFLRRLSHEGVEGNHHGASARIEGLLDTLAASDLKLGREIVELSRSTWLQGAEYEDDFCYAQLIHRLVVPQRNSNSTSALIEQFQ